MMMHVSFLSSYIVQITAKNYLNSVKKTVTVEVLKGLFYFPSCLFEFIFSFNFPVLFTEKYRTASHAWKS